MSNQALVIHKLSKRYRLGVIGRKTLQEEWRFWWHKMRGENPHDYMGRIVPGAAKSEIGLVGSTSNQHFWALKDVSFEVSAGDVVGVIGRNGAGKSTLLKVLSRITEPTEGHVDVFGRIGSLLEVGTGFHPEMTGRENIFMNGAILGMSKPEISRKCDDIIQFAEIRDFIDTPVKRYSSGMYVRLAFAVAAHLEPEILLIDEVLAVGDAGFQKKCLGKMGDVASSGRTILFVSHNMAAIQQLCNRCVVLENGQVHFAGSTNDAVRAYMSLVAEAQATDLAERKDRKGSGRLRFKRVSIHDEKGEQAELVFTGQAVRFRLHYSAIDPAGKVQARIVIMIHNEYGQHLITLNTVDSGYAQTALYREGYFECIWPKLNLRRGLYHASIYSRINGDLADRVGEAFSFSVEDGDFYGTGRLCESGFSHMLVEHSWTNVGSV